MSPRLASMVVYTQAVKFASLEQSATRDACCHMSSFTEKKMMRLIRKQGAKLVKHCARQLVRIYPQGTRINSTNYDPQVCVEGGQKRATKALLAARACDRRGTHSSFMYNVLLRAPCSGVLELRLPDGGAQLADAG